MHRSRHKGQGDLRAKATNRCRSLNCSLDMSFYHFIYVHNYIFHISGFNQNASSGKLHKMKWQSHIKHHQVLTNDAWVKTIQNQQMILREWRCQNVTGECHLFEHGLGLAWCTSQSHRAGPIFSAAHPWVAFPLHRILAIAAHSNICSMFTDLVRIWSVKILMSFWRLVCMVPLNRTGVLEISFSFQT